MKKIRIESFFLIENHCLAWYNIVRRFLEKGYKMKKILNKIIHYIDTLHQYYRLRVFKSNAMPSVMDNKRTIIIDDLYTAALWIFIYSVVNYAVFLSSLVDPKSITGLIMAGIITIVVGYIAYLFGLRKLPQYSSEFTLSRIMYSLSNRMHDLLLTVVLGLELFIGYLVLSQIIPGAQLSLNDSSVDLAIGTTPVIYVGLTFIFLQPLFDGLIIRGYLTNATVLAFTKSKASYLAYVIPILTSTLVHSISSPSLPLVILALYQGILYQWLSSKYNVTVSISVNIVVNILIISTM